MALKVKISIKLIFFLLAAAICLSGITPSVSAEAYYGKTVDKGTSSNNVQTNGYNGSYAASPMRSYLYENNGYLYRVEYTGGKILLEKYNSDFKYIGKGEIEPELPIFGGFFAGKEFIVNDKNNSA